MSGQGVKDKTFRFTFPASIARRNKMSRCCRRRGTRTQGYEERAAGGGGPLRFSTARLRAREFRLGDVGELAAMVADPEQMRFYPRTRTRDEARAWIERNVGLYAAHGFGAWRLELAATGAFAGYCGIRPWEDEIEIGWHVHRSLWGRGLATEAARAACDVAGERFGITRLVAVIPPGHDASVGVAERIGMRRERTAIYEGVPVVVYALELMGRWSGCSSASSVRGGVGHDFQPGNLA